MPTLGTTLTPLTKWLMISTTELILFTACVIHERTDTFFKRTTAQGFYKFMSMMGVETIYNHADFASPSSRAVKALLEFKEVNLFLRGMVPLVGFKSSTVTYDRARRDLPESQNTHLKKMLTFAFDGITSFPGKPIRFITALGAVTFTAHYHFCTLC